MLAFGLGHHGAVVRGRQALADATARAQSWIGDRAPATFRRHLAAIDTVTIVGGSMYRSCVTSDDAMRTYCVIVRTDRPVGRDVRFAGYEPNSSFSPLRDLGDH
jgi:hypothetical protein